MSIWHGKYQHSWLTFRNPCKFVSCWNIYQYTHIYILLTGYFFLTVTKISNTNIYITGRCITTCTHIHSLRHERFWLSYVLYAELTLCYSQSFFGGFIDDVTNADSWQDLHEVWCYTAVQSTHTLVLQDVGC